MPNREGYSIAEYGVMFSEVDQYEKKRTETNNQADVAHNNAVTIWNKVYEELSKLADKYKESEAFKESKLGKMFEPATVNGGKEE